MELISTPLRTDANLQGYWRMNNDWNDYTANAYNLTATNSPTFSAGKHNLGGVFTASSKMYAISTSANKCFVSTSQSWGGWFYPTNYSSTPVFIGRSDAAGANYFIIYITTSGVAHFAGGGLSAGADVASTAGSVPAGQANHLTGVYNSALGSIGIYVNGTATWQACSGTVGTVATQAVAIGRAGNIDNYYCSGTIDDCFMFDKALTTTEIDYLRIDRPTNRICLSGLMGVGN